MAKRDLTNNQKIMLLQFLGGKRLLYPRAHGRKTIRCLVRDGFAEAGDYHAEYRITEEGRRKIRRIRSKTRKKLLERGA